MTHDEARCDIDRWRGSCLNLFARAELAVGRCMEAAVVAGKAKKVRHLQGQKLSDLIALTAEIARTTKQKKAFETALNLWDEVQSHRAFLAHGVVVEAIDRQGAWIAVFDMVIHKGDEAIETRWSLTKLEAQAFHERLTDGFKSLSSQLGLLRRDLHITHDTTHPAVPDTVPGSCGGESS